MTVLLVKYSLLEKIIYNSRRNFAIVFMDQDQGSYFYQNIYRSLDGCLDRYPVNPSVNSWWISRSPDLFFCGFSLILWWISL